MRVLKVVEKNVSMAELFLIIAIEGIACSQN
jgi:hypothetical protein